MQVVTTTQGNESSSSQLAGAMPSAFALHEGNGARDPRFAEFKVIRRNGSVVGFEPGKITVAMTKAFIAVNGGQGAASARVREMVAGLTDQVVGALMRRQPAGGTLHIEDIQDQVELSLMRSGEHDVARAYVLYREERTRERARAKEAQTTTAAAAGRHRHRGRPSAVPSTSRASRRSCRTPARVWAGPSIRR